MPGMWLELTDTLGHRVAVNLALVVSLKEGADGNTILETAAPTAGALHVVVVRERLDEVLALLEGRPPPRVRPAPFRTSESADFVSDGNEG